MKKSLVQVRNKNYVQILSGAFLLLAVCSSMSFATNYSFRQNGTAPDLGYWGYVDINGKEVIPAKYYSATHFNHGYARVYDKSVDANHIRFVNKAGQIFIAPDKRQQDPGLITRYESNGKVIEQDNFDEILDTRGDYMLVRTPYDFSIANRRNPNAPLHKFISLTGFGTNPATGNFWIAQSGKYYEFTGAADKSDVAGCELVTNPEVHNEKYEYIGEFSKGLAPALDKGGFWSYVNSDLQPAISLPLNCCYASAFHEGLAAISLGGRKPSASCDGRPAFGPFPGARYGFIDTSGRVAIPVHFPCPPRSNDSNYGIFKDGYALATAKVNESIAYGYIDRTGKFVIPAKYSVLGQLREGLAPFNSKVVGFDDARRAFDIENTLLQFFKQFTFIGMERQEVHNRLGKPSGEMYEPKAECFFISGGCFGSTYLAVRFDPNNKAIGYTLGGRPSSLQEATMTNGLMPSTWITRNEKPDPDDNLYTFFDRVATEYYTAPYLVPLDTSELWMTDRSFRVYTSDQHPFDSLKWQHEPSARRSMLFGVYHLDIAGKTPQQIESLLGKPERTDSTSGSGNVILYYDLKMPKYGKVELACFFYANHLEYIGLIAKSPSGFRTEKNLPWHDRNLNRQDVGKDFNEYHSYVGLPLECTKQIIAPEHLPTDNLDHEYKLGDLMEIKTSGADHCVKAFRIRTVANSQNESEHPQISNWERLKYSPDHSIFSATRVSNSSDEVESWTVNPFGPTFSSKQWSAEPSLRKSLLFDLLHEHHLVGSSAAEIQNLFGEADFVQTNNADAPQGKRKKPYDGDPLTQDCRWYCVEKLGDRTVFLQLAFNKNVVVAFRLSTHFDREGDQFPTTFSGISHGF